MDFRFKFCKVFFGNDPTGRDQFLSNFALLKEITNRFRLFIKVFHAKLRRSLLALLILLS